MPSCRHLGLVGLSAALLLFAAESGAQPRPEDPDADVEIPAAKPAPPPAASPPAAPPPTAPPPAAPHPVVSNPDLEAVRAEQAKLRAEIAALRAELEGAKKITAPPPEPPAVAPSSVAGGATPFASLLGPGAWGVRAFVQAQYEQHQDSEDQVRQDNSSLNQDRFSVRRAWIQLDAAWQWTELALQIDAGTSRGFAVSVRRAEASVVWRGRPWDAKLPARGPREGDPPLAKLTVGLTDVPFGFELVDSPRDRIFMERSLASLAFFPGERDLAAMLSGGVGFFRYALAVTNGEPLTDRGASVIGDPTKAKDLVLRLGAAARPSERVRVSGGVSALYGKGFHAGTPATKDQIQWNDLNQNGAVDQGELTPVPGTAATPSATFSRWAVGADVELRFRTPLGWTMIEGEATLATNLDRGLFVADPVATGVDVRHLGAYGALTQEITPYGLVGFRFDYYDPNADFLASRGGKLIPTSQAIKTFSPVVGLQLPDRARLLFQYDVVRDLLAKDSTGVPTGLKNDRFTLRLQVQL